MDLFRLTWLENMAPNSSSRCKNISEHLFWLRRNVPFRVWFAFGSSIPRRQTEDGLATSKHLSWFRRNFPLLVWFAFGSSIPRHHAEHGLATSEHLFWFRRNIPIRVWFV
ncbi:hypothetical protein AVEN_183846-1 [Araneus ventricosus]|uniref:Uncharacterized protein n=1 Tax=Araneus ventricosus TaxID=182803 RepID=A0A4Y2BVS7_ARAVE|nr:hypothetical protein AVEN_183846-1 [Araneus ventricosus]